MTPSVVARLVSAALVVLAAGCSSTHPAPSSQVASSQPSARGRAPDPTVTPAIGPEQVAARWPADLGPLTPFGGAGSTAIVAALRQKFRADAVRVFDLGRHGGVIARQNGPQLSIPDVAVVARPGGFRPADVAGLRLLFLQAVLEPIGVEGSAPFLLRTVTRPAFVGAGGSRGGLIPHPHRAVRFAGLVAVADPPGTSFALVAHGLAVIVIGSDYSRDEADRIVRAMQA